MTARYLTAVALACVIPAVPSPGFAALSGFYDSAAQIQLLLESPALADAVRQLPIEDIEFEGLDASGRHIWKIDTSACDVTAWLVAVPPQGVGATRYELAEIAACD